MSEKILDLDADRRWAVGFCAAETLIRGLGPAVERVREDRRLSRAQVGGLSGIHPQKVYRLEKGQPMTLRELTDLCDVLDVNPEELEKMMKETA